MIDIHCHILYGLDDGSDNIEESVRMAEIAVRSGVKAIIATPHSNVPDSYRNFWSNDISQRLALLNRRLEQDGIPLKIFPGNEIFAGNDVAQLIKSKKLLTLNNSIYPLVEFDFFERSDTVYRQLESLVAEGYVPIVAHPERYAFVHEDESAVYRLKSIGCLLQLNKGSINGSFGRNAFFSSRAILSDELADFVASDAHSPYMRTPFLEEAHEEVSIMTSYDYAELIFSQNPAKVLLNKKI